MSAAAKATGAHVGNDPQGMAVEIIADSFRDDAELP
jgi:hypothetical protein